MELPFDEAGLGRGFGREAVRSLEVMRRWWAEPMAQNDPTLCPSTDGTASKKPRNSK